MATIMRRFRVWDWDGTWSALQYDGMDSINKVRRFCWKSFRHLTGGPSPRPLSFSGFDTFCHSWTIKTPKHVVLPMTVKQPDGECWTDNHYRFGHGLSYSQIEEVETARRQVSEDDNECSRKPTQTAQRGKLSSHEKRWGRRFRSNQQLAQPVWTIWGTS